MKLRILAPEFAVCKAEVLDPAPLLDTPFVFLARTDDELSLVCEAARGYEMV